MNALDWSLVLIINGGIVLYGLIIFREQGESFDWYLAAKSMPWWVIGLSAFGTAVDSGDYVAVVGGAYDFGLSQLSQWWLGISLGWILLSFFVVVPMYRSGVFTNAEWLEFRFGPTARLVAVLINIQSRTNVLGNIFFSLFLVFNLVGGLKEGWSWGIVVTMAVFAALYIFRGGLKAGVFTDAAQSTIMIVASVVLWGAVWGRTGGWTGLTERLNEIEPGLADTLLSVGGYSPPGVPPLMVVFGLLISLITYAVINQYEAIRFLGARSEWDFKMAALVASVATAVCLWFNVSMGPLARAEFPYLEIVDQAYPLMLLEYVPAGLIGLVVAGLIAAGFSTFDSVGIGISSLFVRDLYARYLVRYASDAHYTMVGKCSVPIIFILGFAYVPFIQEGMLKFYLRLAGAIAVPLMVVMMMGVFTRVHRKSGAVGLLTGLGYGVFAIVADFSQWGFPVWLIDTWWTYLWNTILPISSMLLASAIISSYRGKPSEHELRGLIYSRHEIIGDLRELMGRRLKALEGTWLQKTLIEAPIKPRYPFKIPPGGLPWFKRPGLWACLYLAVATYLLFFVLW
ncbi:MAG: Sodium/glucose cotransporter [Candidatus Moanabacter tarae]|uniref:Sodium/glucose cotransporter n=1 Tax=Candidatus Moanibacter tarae TaxID=2200854 RepID=A0A2Z4ARG8_9BACT|nr:MAG: Sodium/glucose cotransporter [Candidatus Moanabacter tarae]|tara:strand:- start:65021 stop:66727 length:1707 start_codon:yes stop_codon:yes gene_type:complete